MRLFTHAQDDLKLRIFDGSFLLDVAHLKPLNTVGATLNAGVTLSEIDTRWTHDKVKFKFGSDRKNWAIREGILSRRMAAGGVSQVRQQLRWRWQNIWEAKKNSEGPCEGLFSC